MSGQYESQTIVTKDGKIEWVDCDSHFQSLIREYIGDSAADWYEQRIKAFGEIKEQIDKCFPYPRTLTQINKSLDEMKLETWQDLFWTLSGLRGWDER